MTERLGRLSPTPRWINACLLLVVFGCKCSNNTVSRSRQHHTRDTKPSTIFGLEHVLFGSCIANTSGIFLWLSSKSCTLLTEMFWVWVLHLYIWMSNEIAAQAGHNLAQASGHD